MANNRNRNNQAADNLENATAEEILVADAKDESLVSDPVDQSGSQDPDIKPVEPVQEPVDTTRNQTDATVTASKQPMTLSTGDVQFMSSGHKPPAKDESLVSMTIKYPKGFKGVKHHKEGQLIEVSQETADLFIARGIAVKN